MPPNKALESLDKELRIATGQRPKLEAYLT
jgi:hypothetical protein